MYFYISSRKQKAMKKANKILCCNTCNYAKSISYSGEHDNPTSRILKTFLNLKSSWSSNYKNRKI